MTLPSTKDADTGGRWHGQTRAQHPFAMPVNTQLDLVRTPDMVRASCLVILGWSVLRLVYRRCRQGSDRVLIVVIAVLVVVMIMWFEAGVQGTTLFIGVSWAATLLAVWKTGRGAYNGVGCE